MPKLKKLFLIAFVLSGLFSAEGQAATINAANCSRAAVSNAINAAVDGDTVVIASCPAGVSWTTKLLVTKGITIRGQGIGQTVLIDDVPKGDSICGNSNPMLAIVVNLPNSFRLTELTVRGSAPNPFVCNTGHLALGGTSKAFRVDHVRFENQQTSGIRTSGYLWGVIDHCEFEGDHENGVIVSHINWGAQSSGDGSWAAPTNLGSREFIFIEDCTFTYANPVGAGAFDVFDGGRVVFRHNTASFLVAHGTESSGRRRGVRAFEIYENTFTAPGPDTFTAIFLRGGTGVLYNNAFIGSYTNIILAANFRDNEPFNPWGQCNGTTPFDQNLSGQTGYACLDQVGRGAGDLISGDPPRPLAWPNQELEPVYQWGNILNGAGNPTLESRPPHIQVNRDFFNNVMKPGYIAFPYPHPLTLTSEPPVPPTNLGAIVQ